jgi:hypothetical protein
MTDQDRSTFFQNTKWPMLDVADPLSGWEMAEVLQTSAGNATNDLYGKLYVHIHSLLHTFKQRLASVGAKFELYNLNARDLPRFLAPNTFARIEVWLLGPCFGRSLLNSLRHRTFAIITAWVLFCQ